MEDGSSSGSWLKGSLFEVESVNCQHIDTAIPPFPFETDRTTCSIDNNIVGDICGGPRQDRRKGRSLKDFENVFAVFEEARNVGDISVCNFSISHHFLWS